MTLVSIIVPAYNRAEELGRLLDSFDLLEAPESIEIILVDDGSTDDTPATVQTWLDKPHPFQRKEYLRLPENRGPAHARNQGIAAATGDAVVFTDTDCIVAPDWVSKLCARLDPDQRIGGVGGQTQALSQDNLFSRYNTWNQTLQPGLELLYLVTCNCCYLREALLAVGGFDEEIHKPGGEDVAASIRMWKAGWRFDYAPDALVWHDHRSDIRGFVRTFRHYGYGGSMVAHRYLEFLELEWQDLLQYEWAPHIENYWPAYPIKPAVGGVRTLRRDQADFFLACRKRGLALPGCLELAAARALDRMAYWHGWRQAARELRRAIPPEEAEQQEEAETNPFGTWWKRPEVISVVLPVHNQAQELPALLEHLAAQERPEEVELLVVDDASSDDTPGVWEAWRARPHPFHDARYLRQPTVLGETRARIRGMMIATGDIVAFATHPAAREPGWLRRLRQVFD